MKSLLFILIGLFLSGCRTTPQQNLPEIVKYGKATMGSLREQMKSIQIIRLDHQDKILFGEEPLIVHRDSSFYIADLKNSRKIYRFNEKGKLLDTIGQEGRGNQEYPHIRDFYVCEDQNDIYILSNPDIRLYQYDKAGNYKGMKLLADYAHSLTMTGNRLWFYSSYNNGYHPEQILSTDTNLTLTGKYLPLETKIFSMFEGRAFSDGYSQTYLKLPFQETVYQVTPDTILPVIRFDFGELNVPQSFWNSDDPIAGFNNLCNNGFIFLKNIHEGKNHILAELLSQKSQGDADVHYYCGIKNKQTNQWEWQRSDTQNPEWYAGKMKGFTKDGHLIVYISAYELEKLSPADRQLITNPEALEHSDPEMDMFLFLCTLK